MKGDFTRVTFRPERHYRGVRWQQGRVQNEADDNEQADIMAHRIETETVDAIGASGVPINGGGYAIGVNDDQTALTISPGRLYVGGLLCELEQPGATLDLQPDLPLTEGHEVELGEAPGRYLVYAHAWVRHVTAIEDPYIREKALGGPDTCTRTQTVCQVKLRPLTAEGPPPWVDCETFGLHDLPELTGTGRLRAGVAEAGVEDTPCLVPPQVGYRRLENQLYRVEIHRGGVAGEATFKWSRDNGTVVFPVAGRDGARIMLQDLGPDDTRSVDHRHIVELVDDALVLQGRTTPLLEVDSVDLAQSSITVVGAPPSGVGTDPALHPLVRRWDHQDPPAGSLVEGAILVVEGEPIALEGGIEIEFEPASEGSPSRSYRPGEHWLIPARTVTGDVEWPRGDEGPRFLPPRGREPRVAALAVVERAATDEDEPAQWEVLHDCRKTFVAQAEHVELDGIGGDGQILLHEGIAGLLLPQPLEVRVRRGGRPWPGARVRFRVVEGEGSLAAGSGFGAVADVVPGLTLETNAHGVAACRWTLGAVSPSQRVEAYLLRRQADGAGFVEEEPPIAFSAAYIEALAGRCAVELAPGMGWFELLEEIDAAEGVTDVAICFAAGRYDLVGGQRIAIHGKRSIEISGAGMGTAIASGGADSVLGLYDCEHVTVRDVFVDGVAAVPGKGGEGSIAGVLEIQGALAVQVQGVTARTATAAVPRFAGMVIDGRSPEDPLAGICEVRVRGCDITPSDEQIGLWVSSCSRVTIEDNVVGHAPNLDRAPVSLSLAAKLANDVYAGEVTELALRDLSRLQPDDSREGLVVLAVREGVELGVRPHPEIADQVRKWLSQRLPGLSDRQPAQIIEEIRRLALTELRGNHIDRSWGKYVRESMLSSSTPLARAGIVVTGEELPPVGPVSARRSGAGAVLMGLVAGAPAPTTRSSASSSEGTPEGLLAGSSAGLVTRSVVTRSGASRSRPAAVGARLSPGIEPTPPHARFQPVGDAGAGDGFRLTVGERDEDSPAPAIARLDLDYLAPGAVFHPRSRAEVRVMNNTVTHVRQGLVVEPRMQPAGARQLGTVELSGNVVWISVAIDGAKQEHVGVSVGGAESLVVSRNRVQVDRPARVRTDAMGLRVEGVRVEGTLGPLLVITENLMVGDLRGADAMAWDVGIRLVAAEGSAKAGGGRLWRMGAGENAFWGDWAH